MKLKIQSIDFSSIVYILLGGLIISWVLWYNGYPLVYADTGTYVVSAHNFEIPHDRPKSYGEFIALTGRHISLFIPIIIQTLILSFVIFDIFSLVLKKNIFKKYFLISCLILSFTTGLSWYSAQVMPDIFSSILILSSLNLLLRKSKNITRTALNIFFILFAISFHNSHVFLAFQLLIVLLLVCVFRNKLRLFSEIKNLVQKTILISLVYGIGFFITPTIHYLYEGEFIYAKSSHVILISKFVENGTLKSFLKERCVNDKSFEKEHSFCTCYEEIPNNVSPFLWDENSSLIKTGGWGSATKKQYNSIMKEMLLTPKYFWANLFSTLKSTISQLFRNSIGEGLTAYKEGSAPYYVIHEFYPDEANSYDLAHQNGDGFNFDFLNHIQIIILLGSLFILIQLKDIYQLIPKNQKIILIACILSIFMNSLATGGLHFAYARFQARVIWLLPLCILIIFFDNKEIIINSLKKTPTN